MSDQLRRFLFEQQDARGCIVHLRETCEAIQATHHYPPNLAVVLNQFAAAVALLRDSIKIDGSVTLQMRSPGAISLIMADCTADRKVRAVAEFDQQNLAADDSIDFTQLGDGAVLAITITPDQGERYQAIVPIEHSELEGCLEDYFARSEQLPSWFRLLADNEQCIAIAIHALPAQIETDSMASTNNFEHLQVLLKSINKEEALSLNSEQILTRLFHAESCRLFPQVMVEFGCPCSKEKSLAAIKALGEDDITALIEEEKAKGNHRVVVDCHFCFQRYEFEFSEF